MQTFIGFDDNAMKYNRAYTISAEKPTVSVHQDVLVAPIWPTMEGNFLEELGGGVFDRDGRFLDAAAQPRSDNRNAMAIHQAVTPPISTSIAGRLPKAVFGGVAFDHFGHFLLEGCARLWCLEDYKDIPWLFLTNGQRSLKEYQRAFLAVLGLPPSQIIPISEWHRVDELVIPQLAFTYHHYASHAYRDTFRRARVRTKRKPRQRIFLSRTNTTIARTVGEQELEALLAADGWEIVFPEKLPAPEQAAVFRDENVILGLQGSAMHLALFAEEDRRIVHLCRGLAYRAYYLLDDLVQVDATYFSAMRNHPLVSKPVEGPFLLDLDRTVAFLREQGLLSPAGVSGPGPSEGPSAALDQEYAAWWHHTESQLRFHHQIADDGSPVPQTAALDSALRAVELHPRNPTILGHAIALLFKFRGTEAAGALIDAHWGADLPEGETADDAQLLFHLSLIRDARGDYPGAEAAVAKAVALVPDNASYANQYAAVLYRLQRYQQVHTFLSEFITREGGIAGNYFILSLVAGALEDTEGAIHWAELAVKTDRTDESCCRRLVGLLTHSGRSKEALEVYQGYLERCPNNVGVLLEMAILAQRLGHHDLAIQHLLAAQRLDPDSEETFVRAVELLTDMGRLPDLIALEHPPTPAAQRQSVIVYRRSKMLADGGSNDEALKLAMIAAEMSPENETVIAHLIGLMVIRLRSSEARILVQVLLKRGRASGQLFYALSLIESSLGEAEKAKDAARKAFELDPGNADIASHYQRFLTGLSDQG